MRSVCVCVCVRSHVHSYWRLNNAARTAVASHEINLETDGAAPAGRPTWPEIGAWETLNANWQQQLLPFTLQTTSVFTAPAGKKDSRRNVYWHILFVDPLAVMPSLPVKCIQVLRIRVLLILKDNYLLTGNYIVVKIVPRTVLKWEICQSNTLTRKNKRGARDWMSTRTMKQSTMKQQTTEEKFGLCLYDRSPKHGEALVLNVYTPPTVDTVYWHKIMSGTQKRGHNIMNMEWTYKSMFKD